MTDRLALVGSESSRVHVRERGSDRPVCNNPRLDSANLRVLRPDEGERLRCCHTCNPSARDIPGVRVRFNSLTLVDAEAYTDHLAGVLVG